MTVAVPYWSILRPDPKESRYGCRCRRADPSAPKTFGGPTGSARPCIRRERPMRFSLDVAPNGRAFQSGWTGRVQRDRNLLNEFTEFFAVKVADSPEVQSLIRPIAHVIALNGRGDQGRVFGPQSLGNEEIYDVFAAFIDHRSHRLAINIVEPSAQQGEALRRQIDDRRRDVDLAVEPRFYGVLIAGLDVHQVSGLERANVGRHHFAGDRMFLVVADNGQHQARGERAGEHRAGGKAAEERAARRPQELPRG